MTKSILSRISSLLIPTMCLFLLFSTSETLAQTPVATVSSDSTCVGGPITLSLDTAIGTIQWQGNIGAGWVNETGPGATSQSYIAMPVQTIDYRALITGVGGTDSSNVITVFVLIVPPPTNTTTDSVRCGIGTVDLSASGTGAILWYESISATENVFIGNNYSPFITNTTTFWAANSDSITGGGGSNPTDSITTTFAGGNGFDGNMFDVVAINTITVTGFSANLNATGVVEIWERAGTYLGFQGSNVGWTQVGTATVTSTGAGTPTNIPIPVSVTINAGDRHAFYVHNASGITYTNGTAQGALYTSDSNIEIYEGHGGPYFALTNVPRVWNGILKYSTGNVCESERIPITAYSTAPPAVIPVTSPLAVCQTDTVTIDLSSANPNYIYTWSPATFLDTTAGPNVIAVPTTTTTYLMLATDSVAGCVTSDTFLVDVGIIPSAGIANAPVDTVCIGATTAISVTSSIGNIQWQINNGGGWINASGAGSDSSIYVFMPSVNADYRAVAFSGGCPNDTSNTVSIDVLSITDPTPFDTIRCGPGPVNMRATGIGEKVWYDSPIGGIKLGSGSPFTINIQNSNTFYVESNIGTLCNVGEKDNTIGNTSTFTSTTQNWGLIFNASQPIYLDRVHVYVGNTGGFITVNLRDAVAGNLLQSSTFPVPANVAKFPLDLGWFVSNGTGFALELQANPTVDLIYNFTGSGYPISTPGCPVVITGYFNPNINSFDDYLYFYDWEISDGCKTNRFPAIATVLPLPPKPSITQNANTLSAVDPAIAYQWYLNGIPIAGATSQSYIVTALGDYQVEVFGANGCTDISSNYTITIISPTGFEESAEAIHLQVYPNPVADAVNISFELDKTSNVTITISNALGKDVIVFDENKVRGVFEQMIDLSNYSDGIYLLQIEMDDKSFNRKLILAR